MKLKEAFRFQNKIEALLDNCLTILSDKDCVTITKRTYLYKKANPNAVNETVTVQPDTEYYKYINEMIEFALFLLQKREELSYKINESKRSLPIDLDSEISLNKHRQKLSAVFNNMSRIKSSELTQTNAGTGYCFNNEGNQISYRCDIENVTTINFDRNKVRKYSTQLFAQADKASLEIDKGLIECEVDFNPPFDVNSNFDEVFEDFLKN